MIVIGTDVILCGTVMIEATALSAGKMLRLRIMPGAINKMIKRTHLYKLIEIYLLGR